MTHDISWLLKKYVNLVKNWWCNVASHACTRRVKNSRKEQKNSDVSYMTISHYQISVGYEHAWFIFCRMTYLKCAFISMGVMYLKSFGYISVLEKVLSHVRVIKVFSSLFVNSKQLPNWLWQGYQLNVSWLLVIPYKMSVLFFKLHKQGINTTL